MDDKNASGKSSKDLALQVTSEDNHNRKPSASCSSKDLVSASCHSGEVQLSSSSIGASDKALCESEVVDLTGVDSPEVFNSVKSSRDNALKSSTKNQKPEIGSSKKSTGVTAGISKTPVSFAPSTIGGGEINVFASQPKTCPFVIELFAGSGRVTAQLKHVGVKAACGVDHKQNSKIAPIQVCDLSTLAGQNYACSGVSHHFWQVFLQHLLVVLVAKPERSSFMTARVGRCQDRPLCVMPHSRTDCRSLSLRIELVFLQQMDCMIS